MSLAGLKPPGVQHCLWFPLLYLLYLRFPLCKMGTHLHSKGLSSSYQTIPTDKHGRCGDFTCWLKHLAIFF